MVFMRQTKEGQDRAGEVAASSNDVLRLMTHREG